MKGIVFNLLEQTVVDRHGEAVWDRMVERSGASGAYTSLGNYETSELLGMVAVAAEELGADPDEVVRTFGRDAIPLFNESYPQFFEPHSRLIPFLLTLNDIIHPEVRKLYPDAIVPVFSYESSDEDLLVMGYVSERGLCSFGEGLIEGAAAHYDERAGVRQTSCTKRGDVRCVFEVTVA